METKIEVIGVEFTFDVKSQGTKKVNFYRNLYGYRSYSNYGRYTYIKEGILSGINYLKPTKSTIIVSRKDAKAVRNFLKSHDSNFDEKIVLLNHLEAKKLGLNFGAGWKKLYEEIKGNENLVLSVDF